MNRASRPAAQQTPQKEAVSCLRLHTKQQQPILISAQWLLGHHGLGFVTDSLTATEVPTSQAQSSTEHLAKLATDTRWRLAKLPHFLIVTL